MTSFNFLHLPSIKKKIGLNKDIYQLKVWLNVSFKMINITQAIDKKDR